MRKYTAEAIDIVDRKIISLGRKTMMAVGEMADGTLVYQEAEDSREWYLRGKINGKFYFILEGID